jgi:nitrate reductase cytochrome c-type subunit
MSLLRSFPCSGCNVPATDIAPVAGLYMSLLWSFPCSGCNVPATDIAPVAGLYMSLLRSFPCSGCNVPATDIAPVAGLYMSLLRSFPCSGCNVPATDIAPVAGLYMSLLRSFSCSVRSNMSVKGAIMTSQLRQERHVCQFVLKTYRYSNIVYKQYTLHHTLPVTSSFRQDCETPHHSAPSANLKPHRPPQIACRHAPEPQWSSSVPPLPRSDREMNPPGQGS